MARLNAADGSLDGSFGISGVETISFGAMDFVNDVTVDTAGQILLAGETVLYNSGPFHNNYTYSKFAVARLNGTDGSLDGGFGTGGETTIDAGYFSGATKVAIDPAGRILLAGNSDSNLANGLIGSNPAVVRLTAAGAVDNSFGTSGLVVTKLTGPQNDVATGLAVTQSDGKSLIVGTSGGVGTLALARYNPDGSLDASFGSGGRVTFDDATGFDLKPTAVTVDYSGRILVAGNFPNWHIPNGSGGVLRLNADGSVDTTFGVGGLVSVYDPRAVAVDSAGRIVIAQFQSVIRLNADGGSDASFGNSGVATISFAVGTNFFDLGITGLALDAAGHIVVVGNTSAGLPWNAHQIGIVRLNTDGTVDTAFGSGGETTFNFGSFYIYDGAQAVAIDGAGRIDVAGTTHGNSGYFNTGVIQLNANGLLNTGFGSGGKTVFGFFLNQWSGGRTVSMAIDVAGRIALASSAVTYSTGPQVIVDVLKPDGCPDVDFFIAGQMASSTAGGPSSTAAGVAFDASGRLMVASTAATLVDGQNYPGTSADFALTRYLGHDPVVEATSATFAADLQAAVTGLQTTPPVGTPRVVIHADNPAEMSAVTAALNSLSVNPAGPTVEVLLDLEAGAYSLAPVSIPAGLRLILDGDGRATCAGTFASSLSAPALTVVSGDVIIRDGAVFTGSGNVPAILVQGGHVTVRNSTITETTTTNQAALVITGGQVDLGTSYDDRGNNTIGVNGTGVLIHLTGSNNVLAIGNTFLLNGQSVYDNFQTENLIDHSLDGLGGGTVFWVPNNVFVTLNSGSIQRGVNVVPVTGWVNVQTGVNGGYNASDKLLTIAYDNGLTITQQADSLDATKRSLVVANTYGYSTNNSVKFTAGTNPGEVQLKINALPIGTFLPTGRLIDYGSYGDDIQVDSAIFLPAWLYGGGNGRLRGGSGNNVLIGGGPGELLVGGAGRSLLIGNGGSKLQSIGGQDILIAGYTSYTYNEIALAAIMAEWTSTDSLATRVADISDNTASPLFSASRKNGNYFLIDSGPNQTVFNDYSVDTVSIGGSLDWIFASTIDKITGLTADDVLFIYGA